MMKARGVRRWRWQKLLSFVILGYFAVWFGQSSVHYIALRHDEAQARLEINRVAASNHVLSQQLADLKNPAYVKRMLKGQAVTPHPEIQSSATTQSATQ